MNRLPTVIVLSLLLGAFVIWRLPGWQAHILTPGTVRQINRWDKPVEITLGDRKDPKLYYIFDQAMVDRLLKTSKFTASQGIALRDAEATAAPVEVKWKTYDNRTTTTHRAPGVRIHLRVTAEALKEVGVADTAELRWGGSALEKWQGDTRLMVRNGAAISEADHLVLGRWQTAADDATKTRTVVMDSLIAGTPIAVALLTVWFACFGFPKSAPSTKQTPLSFPATFEREFKACRIIFSCIGGIFAFTSLISGVMSMSFGETMVDLTESVQFNAEMALVMAGLIGGLTLIFLAQLRSAQVTREGIEVRGGIFNKLKFESFWSDIKAATVMKNRARSAAPMESFVLVNSAGRKVRIASGYVQDYLLLRDVILEKSPPGAVA